MPHTVDASGSPIRHTRPSPRTLGKTVDPVTKEETYFTKFGTQQLKFIDPKLPALGVKQLDVGQSFKGLTTSLFPSFGEPTLRSTATISKAWNLSNAPPPPPFPNGNGEDCGWFGEKCWGKDNGEDCGWFGEKCWGKDNGEDCGWFGEKCWFKGWDLGWLKWVLLAVGIGILLWLLRPLFSMIGVFKGGAV